MNAAVLSSTSQSPLGAQGFTLLEGIMTLVILAVLGTVLVPFTRGGVVGTARAAAALQEMLDAQSVMEGIVAEHHYLVGQTLDTGIGALDVLQKNIQDGSGSRYTACTYTAVIERIGFAANGLQNNDPIMLKVSIVVGQVTLTHIFWESP